MRKFSMWGGNSYLLGELEAFESLEEACAEYVRRYESNGVVPVDGIFYPCWGDCGDDDLVIVDAFACEGWDRATVFAVADGTLDIRS